MCLAHRAPGHESKVFRLATAVVYLLFTLCFAHPFTYPPYIFPVMEHSQLAENASVNCARARAYVRFEFEFCEEMRLASNGTKKGCFPPRSISLLSRVFLVTAEKLDGEHNFAFSITFENRVPLRVLKKRNYRGPLSNNFTATAVELFNWIFARIAPTIASARYCHCDA